MLARVRERLLRKDEPTYKDLLRAYNRGYRWRWIREHRSALQASSPRTGVWAACGFAPCPTHRND